MNMKITWKEFLTDNKILLLITFCSVLIIIKNSSAPYIFGMEKLFSWLLNRSEEGTVWGEIFAVLENLSLAYLMSFIFYVLTCYIPERKRELRAQLVISRDLSKLYEGLDKLLTSVLFEVGIYNKSISEMTEITDNELCSIKEYAISDVNKYQAMTIVDSCTEEEIWRCDSFLTSAFFEYQEASDQILSSLKGIKSSPLYANLDEEILMILAGLEKNALIGGYYEYAKICVEQGMAFVPANIVQDFMIARDIYLHLSKFNFEHTICRRWVPSDEMIAREKESIELTFLEHPEWRTQLHKMTDAVRASNEPPV